MVRDGVEERVAVEDLTFSEKSGQPCRFPPVLIDLPMNRLRGEGLPLVQPA